MVAMMLLAAGTGYAQVVETTADWKVATDPQELAFFNDPGFDDSGYANASVNWPGFALDGNSVNGLWSSSELESGSPQAFFRYVFTVSNPVTLALLDIGFYETVAVWINGTQVGGIGTPVGDHENWNGDVTTTLLVGLNVISAAAEAPGNAVPYTTRTFAARLEIFTVPEPTTGLLVGLSLLGAVALRRRT
jgi:hypothetical protein